MSEALDRVRDVRELPLFPLPLVLFPGMPAPLHIFEARYKQMLHDIQAGDNLFGLSFFEENETTLGIPAIGHAGCVAEVAGSERVKGGRSNIIAVGLIRYHTESYVDRGAPYLVANVSFFEDDEEDSSDLAFTAGQVLGLFMRIARAVKTIDGRPAALPDLYSLDPASLSFLIAGAMEIDNAVKLEMLEMRSTTERFARLETILSDALGSFEERAREQEVARGNGHTGRKVDME